MDSNNIFNQLQSIFEKYEPNLSLLHNTIDNYYLNTPTTETIKKSEFFGAVQVKKSYVAFHLMPIYYYPELLDTISEELKKKIQGKSWFNFKDNDEKLFAELKSLTESSFDKYKSLNKV